MMIMQIPITSPRIMESLRRRDLIIETKLLIPGMVSKEVVKHGTEGEVVRMLYSIHPASLY